MENVFYCEDLAIENVDNVIETYYKVIIDEYPFQILKLSSNSILQYHVIDDKGQDCVKLCLSSHKSEKVLYLSQVMHRQTCPIGKTMSRGLPTILMIKSLLYLVMKDTTEFDKVYLTDETTFNCESSRSTHEYPINAAEFNFLIYGKTWYERHFNAQLVKQSIKKKINKSNALLEQKVNQTDLNELMNDLNLTSTNSFHNSIREIIQTHSHDTWRHLFFHMFSKDPQKTEKDRCICYIRLKLALFERFKMPYLHGQMYYVNRKDILAYTNIEIMPDNNPSHVDKMLKESMIKSSMFLYMGGGYMPIYSVRKTNQTRKGGIQFIPSSHPAHIEVYKMKHPEKPQTRRHRRNLKDFFKSSKCL